MAKQHDPKRRPSMGEGKPDKLRNVDVVDDDDAWESDLASSTAPSTDESSMGDDNDYGHVTALDEISVGSSSEEEEEEEEDYTHDMEQRLHVALEFQCSLEDIMPDLEECDAVGGGACDQSDDRTVDSLVLTRRRFAKNRQEKVQKDKVPGIRLMNVALDGKEIVPPLATSPDLKALLETRERLVKFTQDSERRRNVLKKHDSIELTKKRHPDLIHSKDSSSEGAIAAPKASVVAATEALEDYANRYLKKRIRPLMRTKDSLEIAREKLPHCIHTRTRDEECIEDDDELSLGEAHHDCFEKYQLDELVHLDCDSDLDDDEEEWDSDFDPFEDDLDSIVVNKERMSKHKKQSAPQQEQECCPKPRKDDHPRFKDMHYGRMGLCDTLLQSAGPNTRGANCAA